MNSNVVAWGKVSLLVVLAFASASSCAQSVTLAEAVQVASERPIVGPSVWHGTKCWGPLLTSSKEASSDNSQMMGNADFALNDPAWVIDGPCSRSLPLYTA